jgi:protein TonB
LPGHQAKLVPISAAAVAGPQSGIADVSGREDQVGSPEESPAVDYGSAGSTGEALVEAMPNYRSNPLPEYPYIARQRHWEGVVWLLVDVSAEGLVDDVDVERSCGYRALDRSARKTVQRWEFTPAMRAGLPVESQVRIPVRFSLEDS